MQIEEKNVHRDHLTITWKQHNHTYHKPVTKLKEQ